MNKYYIRYNPANRFHSPTPAWILVEVADGEVIKKHNVFDVAINTNTWTERSKEEFNWWNITCEGYLTIQNGNATINSQPPVSSGDI